MKPHPFKQYDGMTVEGSTVSERQEIYDLLCEKELFPLADTFHRDNLKEYSLYYSKEDYFVIGYSERGDINNIPYAEFKRILSEL